MAIENTELWDAALRVVEEARIQASEAPVERELLYRVLNLIEFYRKSTCLTFLKENDRAWICDGFTVSLCIEKLQGERSRVVVEMSDMAADEIRHKFGLMRVPAPLDATEAIVRATHSLASVADKMTDALVKLATLTVSQTSTAAESDRLICVCGHEHVLHGENADGGSCHTRRECACRKWVRRT